VRGVAVRRGRAARAKLAATGTRLQGILNSFLMRRLTLIIGFVSVLAIGGAGRIVAAAVCAHGTGAVSAAMEDHECCRARLAETAKTSEHCQTKEQLSSHHASAAEQHQADTPHAMTNDAGAQTETPDALATANDSGDSSCAHCLSRSEQIPATATAREQSKAKRELLTPTPRAEKLTAATFIPFFTIAPTQHAPPPVARRHLLISIFLI